MKRQLSNKDLTSGTVWKRLLVFFLPIAAGTCIQQLYNAVDGLIVGRFVGTVALAAVGGSSAQVINVLIGFFVAVTAGASVVIAQIYGAGRSEDVRIAAGNAIAVFALLGLFLMVLGLLASPAMLRMLQTPEGVILMPEEKWQALKDRDVTRFHVCSDQELIHTYLAQIEAACVIDGQPYDLCVFSRMMTAHCGGQVSDLPYPLGTLKPEGKDGLHEGRKGKE